MVSCAVSGCNSGKSRVKTRTSTHGDLKFSRFPNNEVLQKMWLSRCGQNEQHDIRKMYVCSKHFQAEDFYRRINLKTQRAKILLKRDAVPSLNLPILIRDCLQSEYASVVSTEFVGPTNTDDPNVEIRRINTKEYEDWMNHCIDLKESERPLEKPFTYPLQFSKEVMLTGKVPPPPRYPSPRYGPTQKLTAEQIKKLKQEISSVNRLVAEWMILTQRNIPDFLINGDSLKEKAKEVGRVLKTKHFNVNLGWLHGFELYLNLNGITHWSKPTQSPSTAVNKVIVEQSIPKDCNVEVVEVSNDSSNEQSIQTYREALENVNLLEEYFRSTQNNDAIELVTHMQTILINSLE